MCGEYLWKINLLPYPHPRHISVIAFWHSTLKLGPLESVTMMVPYSQALLL